MAMLATGTLLPMGPWALNGNTTQSLLLDSMQLWRLCLFQNLRSHGIPIPEIKVEVDLNTGIALVVEKAITTGFRLSQVWSSLNECQKAAVFQQLRGYVVILRNVIPYLTPPPCISDRFISRPGCDPSRSRLRYDNNAGFVAILRAAVAATRDHPDECDAVEECIERLADSRDGALYLSHGNLNADNIYLGANLKVVGIADWDQAGVYPHYWEFVKARLAATYEPTFADEAHQFLDACEDELELVEPAHRLIW